MSFKFETTAYFKDGKLLIRNRSQLESEALNSGLNEFDVVIQKKSKHRSAEQNRWYWSCVTILANELGYSKEEMHEILKFKFLKAELADTKTGEVFEYLKSSANLTTVEFSTFMESLIQWSAETFNVVLPMPNEQIGIEFDKR